MKSTIVIIGGGAAAVNALKAVREVDSEADIHLFGNEKFYPYSRIKLTKSLFENLEEDKLLLQKKEWYEHNRINLHLDREVIGIDSASQEIILEDNSRFHYDKLLIASGSSNFTPPIEGIDKKGVYTIRKLADLQYIRDNIYDKNTIFTIGGGVQNIETAWILSQHGKKVVLAEAFGRLMPRQLDERGSDILRGAIENVNVELLLNAQVEKITGESSAAGVVTKDSNTPCDMVIYAVGVRPNVKFLKDSPVNINRGILVDDNMKTNIENIYAAGDVAEIEGKIGGLWSVAVEQGKIAGYNMAGRDVKYGGLIPATTLNAFNLSLFSMGEVDDTKCDMTLLEDSTGGKVYKRIFIKDNKIAGAIVIGDNKSTLVLRSAIEKGTELNNVDLSSISVDDLLGKLKNS